MTVSRPRVLQAGDTVRLSGSLHTVVSVSAATVRLRDVLAEETELPLPQVMRALELVSASDPAPLPPAGVLNGLPPAAAELARWWEGHIIEVLTGRRPDAAPGSAPRPEYDPARHSLRQRELRKHAELVREGHEVSFAKVKRLRLAYETDGLWGLVDQRTARPSKAVGRVDDRVVAAVSRAIAGETTRSTGTVSRLRRRVQQILVEQYGDDAPEMPSPATFYRVVARLSQGKHTFGSAKTRRSLAKAPEGPFGAVTALRPGEWMQVDSTPLDVRVVLDTGVVDRAELTWMVDLATRSIPAAVLRPTTKAVDAAVLLARTLTPEPMRPGWSDAVRMARSVFPHRRLVVLDERLEQAAARPVIVPETIVCDHGRAYISQTFRSACRAMGINFQPTHKGSPWEKGVVERSFDSVGTLFAQYVAGYVGPNVERRGENADQDAVWSMAELQALLDEWLVVVWQNRPHGGLRHPLTPGKALTPNEQYAALVEVAGYVPVPLSADDYVELLPVCWRAINRYGIKISHRTYDSRALNPYRGQHSGIAAKKGLWEVHHDPYDVTRIWVRNHHASGWITLDWKHLKAAPAPFGELAWDHARTLLAERGHDDATEAEIAEAANDLLSRAERGPQKESNATRRDRRVAGRTRATSEPTGPRPAVEPEPVDIGEPEPETDSVSAEQLAQVIPLPVFDARREAEKWRF
ncbi:Mu transposase C-terminal domain-containing protein [Dactylosporangium sp. NPDC000244]|uniref:Mu transposase C-terminal domain-containing protein n=1 Tax=Dactylosporangium sp. NPDC000244 TaxID=3154365 RepID=UPI00332F4248